MQIIILVSILVLMFYFWLKIMKKGAELRQQQDSHAIDYKEVDCKPHEWVDFKGFIGENYFKKAQQLLTLNDPLITQTIIPRLSESLICKKCGYISGSDNEHLKSVQFFIALKKIFKAYSIEVIETTQQQNQLQDIFHKAMVEYYEKNKKN